MKTYFEIKFDEEKGEAIVCERDESPVLYPICVDSIESIAECLGRALMDYIEGIG